MEFIYNTFVFIMLLIVVGLFMYFIISIEKFENFNMDDVRDVQSINQNLLQHSVMIQDNVTEEYENVLNKDSLKNSIKFVEGFTWNSWITVHDSELSKIGEYVKKHIEDIVSDGMSVILCKLNRYRSSLSTDQMVFLDYDIVLFDKSKKHADHAKLLCVYKEKHTIDIIHFKVIGKIHEDQIYMKNDAYVFEKEYNSYKKTHKYMGDFVDVEDTRNSMQSHDNQVEKLLYNKLMEDDTEDIDYVKNKQHDRAHRIVRNMFLDGLKENGSKKTNVSLYKSYPYDNDFIIYKN